jgi:hypothetical protein
VARARQQLHRGNNSNRARAQSLASSSAPNPYATAAEQQAVIQDLYESSGGMLNTAFKVIDTPFAVARGLAAGDPARAFSWNNRVSGRDLADIYVPGFDQLNQQYPTIGPYIRSATGVGIEIGLDPFAIGTTPLRALTRAGKASRAVGLGSSAQRAALRKLGGITQASTKLKTAENAKAYLKNALRNDRMVTNQYARQRPMVGPRVSNALVTLEEAINSSRNPSKMRTNVEAFLAKQGQSYDAVKGEKLGGLYGLDYFGQSKNPYVKTLGDLTDNPKAYKFLDRLDAIGQSVRFSTPSRIASGLFDKRFTSGDTLAERIDPYNQLKDAQLAEAKGIRRSKQRQAGAFETNRLASIVLPTRVRDALGVDSLLDEKAADFMNRIFTNKGTVSDSKIYQMLGQQQIDDIYQGWKTNVARNVEGLRKQSGLPVKNLKDPFGTEWSPHVAREIDRALLPKRRGGSQTTVADGGFSARTASDIERKFKTPGGVTDIKQINLIPSVQKMVSEGELWKGNIEAVAADIKQFIDSKHGPQTPQAVALLDNMGLKPDPLMRPVQSPIMTTDPLTGELVPSKTEFVTRKQSVNIARTYAAKNRNLPSDMPLFSEHPIKTQMRTLEQQGDAVENALHAQLSLGEAAIHAGDGFDANVVAGTLMVPLKKAVTDIAEAAGLATKKIPGGGTMVKNTVLENVSRAIAKANPGIDPLKVNINEWSVPKPVFDRLMGAGALVKPGGLASFMTGLHKVGEIWRGMLLAFPARHVRDAYANAFQLWLLGGGTDMVYGYRVAKEIFAGNYDVAANLLKDIPSYNLSDTAIIKQKLVNDIAGTGILDTLASSDISLMNNPASYNQIIPGSKPSTINRFGVPQDAIDVFKEQAARGGPKQQMQDYFTFKDFNPLAKRDGAMGLGGVAQDLGLAKGGQVPGQTRNVFLNTSQAVNDYVDGVSRLAGQLMLMRQGIPADVAAKRVTEALIDYGGLSTFEKSVMKKIFPWYSYMSRSGAFAVKQLMTKPGGRYAQSLRFFNRAQESDEDTYVPEALRQQFAIRIPDEYLQAMGFDPSDNNTFIRDIDIPGYDVLSTFSLKPTALGSVQNVAENLLSQSNPVYQGMYEMISGEDLFSKRPLSQANTGADKAFKYLKGVTGLGDPDANLNPLFKQALRLTPGPRITPLIGQLVDQRLPLSQRVPKAAFNALTGVKLQTVDPAYKYGDARQLLSEQLQGVMRDYPMKYVPKDERDKLTADQALKLKAFNTFGKIIRDRREARDR